MKTICLATMACLFATAQPATTPKTANVIVDGTQLPSGYILKYQVSGKIGLMEDLATDKVIGGNGKFLLKSKEIHDNTLNDKIGSMASSHLFTFDLPSEMTNRTDFAFFIVISFSIIDEHGNLIKSSTGSLNASTKTPKISFKIVGTSKTGKPNVRVYIDDPNRNFSNSVVIQK
ncbi:MAG TPA: hypothetical protein VK188_11625 [Holophaga sp.]|nr:hypothetical protein [Holophaga sp.]